MCGGGRERESKSGYYVFHAVSFKSLDDYIAYRSNCVTIDKQSCARQKVRRSSSQRYDKRGTYLLLESVALEFGG